MSSLSDPVPLPEPTWLAGHSDPIVDAMLSDLSDETRQLYRRYLGAEVRAMRPDGRSPAWRAFDRTLLELMRRRQEPEHT